MQSRLTVREVMEPAPIGVPVSASLGSVLALMNSRRVGAVLVRHPDDRLAGIFTERDLLRRIADAPPGWQAVPVSDWMTTEPYVIGPGVSWDEAVARMDKYQVRHLPVLENGAVVGLLSTRRLMTARAERLRAEVDRRTAELRAANDALIARDQELTHSLRAAGRLQTKVLLPTAPPDWPELRWAAHFAPLSHLGGDYYDYATPGPDRLGVLVADASGHSIPAALVAIMARFAFVEEADFLPHPGEVLGAMNHRLMELVEERFVTACYAVYDRPSRTLTYASAGHPPPLHYRAETGTVAPLEARGFMLGIVPDERFGEKMVPLDPGDRVVFYTDGLVEARNEIGELFGNDRLAAALRGHGREGAETLLSALLGSQRAFSGTASLTDDLTAVVLEVV
jgi:serine phosphatase RsbU (regulator of sigma subunit)